jgi:hypothetical protein
MELGPRQDLTVVAARHTRLASEKPDHSRMAPEILICECTRTRQRHALPELRKENDHGIFWDGLIVAVAVVVRSAESAMGLYEFGPIGGMLYSICIYTPCVYTDYLILFSEGVQLTTRTYAWGWPLDTKPDLTHYY